MSNEQTILWHDYETFGLDPQLDNVSQFAAIRTDLDLNPIGDPIDIICRPTLDRLPSPEAVLVTRISPLKNKLKGMNEVSFFQKINLEMSKPNTCSTGYNSLNFDDEVSRNGFFRNFIDPYEREWKNGCSRWDIIDVLRIVDVLKEGTFVVPLDKETGKKVFKLDQLSVANGISHENAHDALSDVYVTIAMAKIIKDKEPELFDLFFKQRKKSEIENTLFTKGFGKQKDIIFKPFIASSSFFGGDQRFLDVLYPIYSKGVDLYCIKITKNIEKILELNPENLKNELFKKKEEMLENETRIPIHTIKINKCPVILPINYLNKDIADSLGFDGDLVRENIKLIKEKFIEIESKLKTMFNIPYEDTGIKDVDQKIYSGFFGDSDKAHFERIKQTESLYLMDYLNKNKDKFIDERLSEMLFRYICRNYIEEQDNETIKKWDEFCLKRITDGLYSLTFDQYFDRINELKIENQEDKEKLSLLKELEIYGNKIKEKLYK